MPPEKGSWRVDPSSGRQVRLVKEGPEGPYYLEWDDHGGPRTPYGRGDGKGSQSSATSRRGPSVSQQQSDYVPRSSAPVQAARRGSDDASLSSAVGQLSLGGPTYSRGTTHVEPARSRPSGSGQYHTSSATTGSSHRGTLGALYPQTLSFVSTAVRGPDSTGHVVSYTGNQFAPATVNQYPPEITVGTHIDSAGTAASEFQIKPSSFFQIGRVFLVIWPEPLSATAKTTLTSASYHLEEYRRQVHIKERRMVVVKAGDGNSWCLPIHTYLGQGCEKNGCRARWHAIVHLDGKPPEATEVEIKKGLSIKETIRIQPSPGVSLDPMSRLNFGRVHTVEHNVPVKNIGVIPRGTRSYTTLMSGWEKAKLALSRSGQNSQSTSKGHNKKDSGFSDSPPR